MRWWIMRKTPRLARAVALLAFAAVTAPTAASAQTHEARSNTESRPAPTTTAPARPATPAAATPRSTGGGPRARPTARAAAPAQAPHARPADQGSAIRRSTDAVTTIGLGGFGAPPPAAVQPGVQPGSTGTVAGERAPTVEYRGRATSVVGEGDVVPIGPADVPALMDDAQPALRRCYDEARAQRRDLAGRVELRFTIDRTGAVTRVRVDGMREVAACMTERLQQLRFPPPASGEIPYVHAMDLRPTQATALPGATPRPVAGRGR